VEASVEAREAVLDESAILAAKAEASEAKYRSAVVTNREKPGTFSPADLDEFYRTYTDEMLLNLRNQVQLLREELREAKRARVRTVATRN
jgi:hypothetical protein